MGLVLTNGPAIEPVTVAEAKAHARIDGNSEDVLIASLILTSRLHIEAALGLALITQSWKLSLDRWPAGGDIHLPLRPARTVSSVSVISRAGVAQAIDPGSYVLDGDTNAPRVVPVHGVWPALERRKAGVEIVFTAGYGDDATDVPSPVRHALLCLVAHWYEHRDPFEMGPRDSAIPKAIGELLMPYQVARL